MLFNSFVFVLAFLPLALVGYYLAALVGQATATLWLIVASLVFYGWWDARFLILLLASIFYNYGISLLLSRLTERPKLQTVLLTVGIVGDLGALFYYKYLFSLLEFLKLHHVISITMANVVLPSGISFFTFTQIAFLVDVRQGVARDRSLLNYLLFVTFFPHLIAGPILHNREMMPQYANADTYRFSPRNLSVGLTIFLFGLFKKCVLADPLSSIVTAGFSHPLSLTSFGAIDALFCYSLQLYFDFSGYSDMAVGLARMFNIRFPLNFNSPYKAQSVVEYWQRFHMTLTRFITLYIYNPISLAIIRTLSENDRDTSRAAQSTPRGMAIMVALPTMITMALAGIWHGAGVQYLIFGLLHGAYITINHAKRIFGKSGSNKDIHGVFPVIWKTALTYAAVLFALIFFRAPSLEAAFDVIGALGRLPAHFAGGPPLAHIVWLGCLYFIIFFMPNTQQVMIDYGPALGKVAPGPFPKLRWQENLWWSAVVGAIACLAILAMGGSTEFIYFQF